MSIKKTIIDEADRIKNDKLVEEYDRELEDKKAMEKYKEDFFGDKKTRKDPMTGKTLHKDKEAAKRKYKNSGTSNNMNPDHDDPLANAHNRNKEKKYITNDDFKKVLNQKRNFRPKSEKNNKSKRSDTNWEAQKNENKSYGDDFKFGMKTFDTISGELNKNCTDIQLDAINVKNGIVVNTADVLNAIDKQVGDKTSIINKNVDTVISKIKQPSKIVIQSTKNVGKEFITGATDTVINAAIPLTTEAVRKMIQVAEGKVSAKNAAKDMGKITVDVAVTGGTNRLLVDALTSTMTNSNSHLLKSVAESNEVGKLIAVAAIVKESAVRYVNGEIDGKEFIEEVGEKGASMVAGMIGGQIGKEIGGLIGATMGIAAGPIGMTVGFVAGEVVGQILGTIITTIACSSIISVYNVGKNLDSYKLKEYQIKRIESDALNEMSKQREAFRKIVSCENKKLEKEIQDGFDLIMSNACKESYNLSGVTSGLDKILSVFGKEVAYKTLEEYESQLDSTLVIS